MKSFAAASSRSLVGFFALVVVVAVAQEYCDAPTTFTCQPTDDSVITIDANLDEWTDVKGIQTPLTPALGGTVYAGGDATYKCRFSDTYLYLTMEIPGSYRFDTSDSAKCASISTMFKVGAEATFVNMGGCPEVLADTGVCEGLTAIPTSCESYRVVSVVQ